MTKTAKFWDGVAVKYAASPISDMAAYEYTLGRTRSYLTPETKALEIGCGTGSTALLLAGDVASLTGTDISPKMIEIAREKSEAEGSGNVSFAVATAEGAARMAGEFDTVMAFNLLHLVGDMAAMLSALGRNMGKGDLLITKTPCLNEPSIGVKRFAFRALIPVLRLIGKAPGVQTFSFAELEAAVTKAGFTIIETSSNPAMSRYIVARKA